MGDSTKSQRSSNKRRQERDPEATQKQILDAAEEEFAKCGLNGARIEAIASRAGVTSAMIHYYFQNKEGLYKTVLQRPAVEMHQMLQQLNLDQLPPEEALKTAVREAIAYEAAHPRRGMLWFQEANQNQGKYFKLGNWQETFAYLIDILERGMAEGTFRKVDPFLTSLQIAGICTFYFNAHENIKHLMPDVDRMNPETIERYTQEAINLILAGVRNQEKVGALTKCNAPS
ncbi:TetR family transcriptional regulator [Microseira sp. BLCC-F43]|uniref:TetR family transcriptional regulator n=1 Tax=Microseira sp. BLCC-F43 TaxID=3153602 RepID=UPI0035B92459